MKRDVEWTDRLEDGTKRTVRVSIERGGIRWRFRSSGQEEWDYATLPTPADWTTLEEKISNRHNRRTVTLADLELVRAMRKEHELPC